MNKRIKYRNSALVWTLIAILSANSTLLLCVLFSRPYLHLTALALLWLKADFAASYLTCFCSAIVALCLWADWAGIVLFCDPDYGLAPRHHKSKIERQAKKWQT